MKNIFLQTLNKTLKTPNESSLHMLLQLLANVSEANICFFAMVDNDISYAKTKVVYAHGKIVSNFTYTLKNTPCMHVMCEEESVFPSNVSQIFPEDILLAQLNIEGYVGAPVLSSEKKHIGILVGLYETKICQIDEIKELYQMVSIMISSQYEKQLSSDFVF